VSVFCLLSSERSLMVRIGITKRKIKTMLPRVAVNWGLLCPKLIKVKKTPDSSRKKPMKMNPVILVK
jgi:hypothetical protein